MPFSFTLFEPKKHRQPKPTNPLVEVRPNGRIMFNNLATSLLGNNHYCSLGYDPENKAIGILPLSESAANSFPVRYTTRGAYIGAKKALRHFGILPEARLQNQPIQHEGFIAVKF
ncbi:MAG: hypothetical protein P4N59_19845 [Negativicutes bacterium]|nr:hypothetical protein [Negativicutes bacterium]